MSRPSLKCRIALVPEGGILSHFLINLSPSESSWFRLVSVNSCTVNLNLIAGSRYSLNTFMLYSLRMREASMFPKVT